MNKIEFKDEDSNSDKPMDKAISDMYDTAYKNGWNVAIKEAVATIEQYGIPYKLGVRLIKELEELVK